MNFAETVLRIVLAIIALGFVLFLAYALLRWLNKRIPGAGAGAGRMITVLDRVVLNRNSSILLVRVQDKVLLVGFSEHAIEKLCEIDDPDGKLQISEVSENISFSVALKDAATKFGFGSKGEGKGGDS